MSLLLVSLTTSWSQPEELTGTIRVSYWDGDPAPSYGVEYEFYKTSSQLIFLDYEERTVVDYTWDRATATITDTSDGDSFIYAYTTANSGTFSRPDSSDTGEFVTYDASWDLDYDGTPDGEQIDAGNLPTYAHKLDMSSDTDGDGLSLAQEAIAGTNPQVRDTDGDGRDDDEEILVGTSPINKNFGPFELEWQVDLADTIPVTYGIKISAEPAINPYNGDICFSLKDGDFSLNDRRIAILTSSGELVHFSNTLNMALTVIDVVSSDTYLVRDTYDTRATFIYKVVGYNTYELISLHDTATKTGLNWGGGYESHDSEDFFHTYGWEIYKYKKIHTIDVFTGRASYGINGENFLIRWSSDSGVQYQIQKSNDLVSWENVGMPITGNGAEMLWAEPFVGDSVFYRLILP